MKTFNMTIFVLLFAGVASISVSVSAQVPEFNAETDKQGKVTVEEDYDPRATCKLCKEMYDARHAIKHLDPKDESQEADVTAGLNVMLKALLGFDTVKASKSKGDLLDYNVQLILLFDRLDRSDDSPTAVERMAAYADNPDAKASYKEALSKVPESLRNRVLDRISQFNNSQRQQLHVEEKALKNEAKTSK